MFKIVSMKTTEQPVVVSKIFDKSIEDVWNAITVKEEMLKWFFDNIPEFKAEVGFTTQFNVKAPSRDFMHLWEVTEVMPQKRLVTNWKYEGMDGDSLVYMELKEMGAQTKFTLTTKVLEDFDDTIPEFQRESCVAGWNYFINERLTEYLK
jgi:uncharacterized protein YndB with AHSA1/START domain